MWIGVDWNIRMKWGSRAAEAIPFLRPAIPLSWARTGLDEAEKKSSPLNHADQMKSPAANKCQLKL